ncbi:MAG: hypothetical protein GX620_01755 [Chloroflexi bacterium]|nr:hypothetical protein [Chloroflexota bacterium]
MKLTRRQQTFLSSFLDIYHGACEPVHYTQVAQELGVSRITAYDMLRLLEQRGLVESQFVLRGKGQGAGRSSIVFRPTSRASALVAEVTGGICDQAQWDHVKLSLLDRLRSAEGADYRGLLEDILARLPERRSPMLYAAETITAIVLSLHGLREQALAAGLFDRLRTLGFAGRVGLSALAGLTLGLSAVEGINRRLIGLLLADMARYQEIIAQLSAENLQQLSLFASDVVRIIDGETDYQGV